MLSGAGDFAKIFTKIPKVKITTPACPTLPRDNIDSRAKRRSELYLRLYLSAVHQLSIRITQILLKVLIGPISGLATSLAEFELFMSFAGLVCLSQKFLSTCEIVVGDRRRHCSRSHFLPLRSRANEHNMLAQHHPTLLG